MNYQQKHIIFAVPLILFAFFISFTGCKKDNILSENNTNIDNVTAQLRNTLLDSTDIVTFEISSTVTLTSILSRQALAYAVSQEMNASTAFRDFIYSEMDPNDIRFKEVVLGQFKNLTIPSRTQTVKQALNERLIELEYFSSVTDPLEMILNQDPLLVLLIKHEYAHSLRNDILSLTLPVLVYGSEENYLHYGHSMVELDEEDEDVLAILIVEAQVNLLFDVSSKTYLPESIPFEDYHGFELDSCTYLKNLITSLDDYEYYSGYKLINFIEIVQGNLESCFDPAPDITSYQPSSGGSNDWMDCPRGYIHNDLEHPFWWVKQNMELIRHGTFLRGFRLSSLATYDFLSSHPCNKFNVNGTMVFMWTWVYAVDENIPQIPRNFPVSVYKTDILKEEYQTFQPFFLAPWIRKTVLVNRELKEFIFPMVTGLFANNTLGNDWDPELNGVLALVASHFVNMGSCTQTNSTVSVKEITLNGEITFKAPKIELGKFGLTYKDTKTKTVTHTMQAGEVFSLGNATIEYCHPYTHQPEFWSQVHTSGMVVTRWLAPWWIP